LGIDGFMGSLMVADLLAWIEGGGLGFGDFCEGGKGAAMV
jgi:hypothetical protein